MSKDVVHEPERQRYVLRVDGAQAGHAAYRCADDGVLITHTEITPSMQGGGLASTLVRGMLDDLRARGVAVRPRCSYVVAFMRRHRDYAALVPADERARLGLPDPA